MPGVVVVWESDLTGDPLGGVGEPDVGGVLVDDSAPGDRPQVDTVGPEDDAGAHAGDEGELLLLAPVDAVSGDEGAHPRFVGVFAVVEDHAVVPAIVDEVGVAVVSGCGRPADQWVGEPGWDFPVDAVVAGDDARVLIESVGVAVGGEGHPVAVATPTGHGIDHIGVISVAGPCGGGRYIEPRGRRVVAQGGPAGVQAALHDGHGGGETRGQPDHL